MTSFARILPIRNGVSLMVVAPVPAERDAEQPHLTIGVDLEVPLFGHFHLDIPLTVALAMALQTALLEAKCFAQGDPSVKARVDLPPIDTIPRPTTPIDLSKAPPYNRLADEDRAERRAAQEQW